MLSRLLREPGRGAPIVLRARRLGGNLAWTFVGTALARLATFALTLTVARLVGIEAVGQVGLVQGTTAAGTLFAGLGLGLAVTRTVAVYRHTDKGHVAQTLGCALIASIAGGILVSALVFLFSDRIWSEFLGQSGSGVLIAIGAPAVLIVTMQGFQVAVLAGIERFDLVALLNLVYSLGSLLLSILGLLFFQVEGCIAGGVIGGALAAGAWFIVITRRLRALGLTPRWTAGRGVIHPLLSFGFPSLLCGIIVDPVNLVCAALIAQGPSGPVQVGLYYYLLPWANIVSFLPNLSGQALTPSLSAEFAQGDRHGLKSSLLVSAALNLTSVTAISIGILCLYWMVSVPPYNSPEAWTALLFLVAANGLASIMASVGQIAVAAGLMWRGFAVNFVWAGVYLITTYLLRGSGAVGIAQGRFLAYCVHGIGTGWLLRSCLRRLQSHGPVVPAPPSMFAPSSPPERPSPVL